GTSRIAAQIAARVGPDGREERAPRVAQSEATGQCVLRVLGGNRLIVTDLVDRRRESLPPEHLAHRVDLNRVDAGEAEERAQSMVEDEALVRGTGEQDPGARPVADRE